MFFKTKARLSIADKLVLVFNVFFGCALLLCYLSPSASPVKYPLIAILGLFYIALLFINLLFIIYWLFKRSPIMLISGVCILLGIGYITRFYSFHKPGDQNHKQPGSIRIMTYNVNSFVSIDNTPSQTGILHTIDSLQPDVLNMQELRSRVGGKGLVIDSIKKALNTNKYFAETFITSSYDSTMSAVFTKFPIVHSAYIPAPKEAPETQAIYVDIKKDNKIFRVYCLHLQSVHFEPEEHQAMREFLHFKKFDFSELKLIFTKLKTGFIKRSYQADYISKLTRTCPYPFIVTGDFNDTPNSYAVSQISKNLKNSFREKGWGSGATYYRDFPSLQIDYIMSSGQFDMLNQQVVHKRLSDHYPVIADVELY